MRSQWFGVLAFSLLLSPAAPSLAAPPPKGAEDAQTASRTLAARTRGEEGLRLFEAGQWAEAFTAFQQADEIVHAPTLVLYMARCRRNQGRLLEAEALYKKTAAEPVPRGAPDQFAKAVSSARTELDSIHRRIPVVRVTISGAPAERTAVTIDNVPLSAEEKASSKLLDPGDHEIVATSDDGTSARKKVSLKEGEETRVELELQPSSSSSDPSAPSKGSRVPAVIAFSVGGVGVAVGAITGGLAFSKIADIKSRCTPDGHCLTADKPAAATAQTLATTSTIGFVAGGVGLAAGALLWWLRPGAPKPSDKPSARVEIGIGSVAIGGQF